MEPKVVTVGWVSLSRSGKSLTIKVLNENFFVPLRDLYRVLDGDERRVEVKQWREEDLEGSWSQQDTGIRSNQYDAGDMENMVWKV